MRFRSSEASKQLGHLFTGKHIQMQCSSAIQRCEQFAARDKGVACLMSGKKVADLLAVARVVEYDEEP